MDPSTIRYIYHKAGIRYIRAAKEYHRKEVIALGSSNEPQKEFARKLAKLRKDKAKYVIYIDETSFNSWEVPKKTWACPSKPISIRLNKRRGKGVTIYGAIGEAVNGVLHMVSRSTNKKDFVRFLVLLRKKCLVDETKELYLVIDNHNAHTSKQVIEAMERLYFTPINQPTYSPEFNCIETMWAVIKK